MRRILVFLLLVTCFFLSSCGSKEEKPTLVPQGAMVPAGSSPETVIWSYGKDAINIKLKASPQLNFINEQAHSTLLCIYQLESVIAFNNLASTSAGIETLLTCQRFDSSVLATEKIIIKPKEEKFITYDRMEKTRYLALVGGFHQLNADLVTRVWSIPVVTNTSGSLWWKEDYYYVDKLSVSVLLGQLSIQILQANQARETPIK